jgi:DNA-binding MarR family transcriptional regulator
VGKTARGRLAGHLAQQGLRLWHMATLAALADFGPQAQRDLGERLAVHASDMAKVVDELATGGLVTRTRDPADRRRVLVTLTPSGHDALTAQTAQATALQDTLLSPLTAPERAELHRLLLLIHQG